MFDHGLAHRNGGTRDQLALLREQAFGAASHDCNVIPTTGKP
jgi:hypothetical protein